MRISEPSARLISAYRETAPPIEKRGEPASARRTPDRGEDTVELSEEALRRFGASEESTAVESEEAPAVQAAQSEEEEEKAEASGAAEEELTPEEEEQVRELEARDREVRAHEQAHASIGGRYASQPSYDYQVGPGGRRYAVGGEVRIDVAPVPGDPEATIEKMRVVRAAAMAPAEPSEADRQVATRATRYQAEARAELIKQRGEEASGGEQGGEGTRSLGSVLRAAYGPSESPALGSVLDQQA